MKLLEAEEVKKEDTRATTEQAKRVIKLNEEESSVVKNLNKIRTEAKTETEKIEGNLKKKREEAKVEEAEIQKKIASRRSALADLMKPIDEISKEAETRNEESKKRETAVTLAESQVKTDRENLVILTEKVTEREGNVTLKEEDLGKRETKIVSEENRLKVSQNKLAGEWVTYHSAVTENNKELERRKKEVEDQRKANAVVQEAQDKRTKEQNERDRAIKDKYETLGRAIAEARQTYGIIIKDN